MHIVMLTNSIWPDKIGGLERYVRELSAQLVRVGVEVTVVAKRVDSEHPSAETGSDGVQIVRYDVPSKRNPLFAVRYAVDVARAVRSVLKTHPEAVLHGHFAVAAIAPALGSQRYLYTCHAPVHRELLSERQGSYFLPKPVQAVAVAGLRHAERKVLRRASTVAVLSQYVAREVGIIAPEVEADVMQIPGGFDDAHFLPTRLPDSESLALADLTWASAAGPLLVVARRLVPRTGVLQLVQAMPTVLRKHPHARLVVVGTGGSEQAISQEVTRLGLGDAVRMTGRVTDAELRAWYHRAQLAITPTQELEGFGLATAEAMACGTPALVTPVGANPEVARLLSDRLVSRGCTPDELAAAITTLLDDPVGMADLAARASTSVRHLGWRHVVAEHLRWYSAHLDRQIA